MWHVKCTLSIYVIGSGSLILSLNDRQHAQNSMVLFAVYKNNNNNNELYENMKNKCWKASYLDIPDPQMW